MIKWQASSTSRGLSAMDVEPVAIAFRPVYAEVAEPMPRDDDQVRTQAPAIRRRSRWRQIDPTEVLHRTSLPLRRSGCASGLVWPRPRSPRNDVRHLDVGQSRRHAGSASASKAPSVRLPCAEGLGDAARRRPSPKGSHWVIAPRWNDAQAHDSTDHDGALRGPDAPPMPFGNGSDGSRIRFDSAVTQARPVMRGTTAPFEPLS